MDVIIKRTQDALYILEMLRKAEVYYFKYGRISVWYQDGSMASMPNIEELIYTLLGIHDGVEEVRFYSKDNNETPDHIYHIVEEE